MIRVSYESQVMVGRVAAGSEIGLARLKKERERKCAPARAPLMKD